MLKKVNHEAATDSYWVNLSVPEMQLVAALIYKMRLGQGNIYKAAAYSILDGIEDALGEDFAEDASTEVCVYFTLEDLDGSIGCTIDSPYGTIEVAGGDVDDITAATTTQVAQIP